MHAERDVLTRYVFPELRGKCDDDDDDDDDVVVVDDHLYFYLQTSLID